MHSRLSLITVAVLKTQWRCCAVHSLGQPRWLILCVTIVAVHGIFKVRGMRCQRIRLCVGRSDAWFSVFFNEYCVCEYAAFGVIVGSTANVRVFSAVRAVVQHNWLSSGSVCVDVVLQSFFNFSCDAVGRSFAAPHKAGVFSGAGTCAVGAVCSANGRCVA